MQTPLKRAEGVIKGQGETTAATGAEPRNDHNGSCHRSAPRPTTGQTTGTQGGSERFMIAVHSVQMWSHFAVSDFGDGGAWH